MSHLQLKNTRSSYGLITRSFHWIMALLFLLSYGFVYYRQWFTEGTIPPDFTSVNWSVLQWHVTIGVTIGVLAMLRLTWRFMNVQPDPLPGTPAEHRAAHWMHILLYFFMIAMPLTGWLGAGGPLQHFGIPAFKDTALFEWLGLSFDEFEGPVDFFHKKIGGMVVVWVLILGHTGAALYHHFVKRDNILRRMLSSVKADK